MKDRFYLAAPCHLLDNIHCFWAIDKESRFHNELIIPKGVIEIVFNFSITEPINVKFGTGALKLPGCFVNGFNTIPVHITLPKYHSFFGVQLQPMAVRKLLGTNGKEFSDQTVDLCLIKAGFYNLWCELAAQESFDKRVDVFIKWLSKQMVDCTPQERVINHFLSNSVFEEFTVRTIADKVCFSPRHLSRKLIESTGLNTEQHLLYKKYLHAVHLMHYTDKSLTQIAYQSSFSDQSHFIHAFQSFAQITPSDYLRMKGELKGHIYKDVR